MTDPTPTTPSSESTILLRSERLALWALGVFTGTAVLGYGVFGLNPGRLPDQELIRAIYNVSFQGFAQIHIVLSAAALWMALSIRTGGRWVPAMLLVAVLAFAAEHLGTGTGIPFGEYSYTGLLGPKLLGRVPYLIPLSWFLMALPAYVIAAGRFPGRSSRLARIATAAGLLTLWDLALDPAMSFLTPYWRWAVDGLYYGMPAVNLAGWFGVGLVLMWALENLGAERWGRSVPDALLPRLLPPRDLDAARHDGGRRPVAWRRGHGDGARRGRRVAHIAPCDQERSGGPGARCRRTGHHSGPPDRGSRRMTVLSRDKPMSSRQPDIVRESLSRTAEECGTLGLAVPPVRGQLLRPTVAFLALPAPERETADPAFWAGALAIQMIHEASLVHDDIVDGAETRRGEPTAVARMGLGASLVWGDHVLTSAYRVALRTGSTEFVEWFIRAVERTVAGELRQGQSRGRPLADDEEIDVAAGKSGELFGAALALAACTAGVERDRPLRRCRRRPWRPLPADGRPPGRLPGLRLG